MTDSGRQIARSAWWLAVLVGVVIAGRRPAWAEVAATGIFGIDVSVSFPFTSGTFSGRISSFDAGPFSVGGTPVALDTDIQKMDILNGVISNINVGTLSAAFTFALDDRNLTAKSLAVTGAGVAKCTDVATCTQGQGTFVADVTSLTDPDTLLPDPFVYTFDGTVAINGPNPTFDASGVFGLNAFSPIAVPMSATPTMVSSGTTRFFDSKNNVLRDFLVDLTFAAVTNPGSVSFLGKSLLTGSLPASITLIPDVSVFIDIVTGNGLAFTPPVEVCVSYDDVNPADGIVDGTSVPVNTLKLLHASAVGQNFVDVTTTTSGGKVCGQVGSPSPFVVAQGAAPTTTTTPTTTTSPGGSTSIPGGSTTTVTVPPPPTTTTRPEPLAGKKLLLKDKSGKPQKRAIDCIGNGITLGKGNTSDDDPVTNGGSLRVRGTGFDTTYPLAASGWKYIGKSGQDKGYKFKGSAIKSVLVKAGKVLHLVGKGSGLGHLLTADPKPVTVTLTLGDRKYCMSFTDGEFKAGTKFLSKGSAAPAVCASPSGAFLD